MGFFAKMLAKLGVISEAGGDDLAAELERLQVSAVLSYDITSCTQLDVYITVLQQGTQSVFAHAITDAATIATIASLLLQYPDAGVEPSEGIPVYERAYVFGHRPVGMPVMLSFVNGQLVAQDGRCHRIPETDDELRRLLEITVPTPPSVASPAGT
jgi:hypothetical protein